MLLNCHPLLVLEYYLKCIRIRSDVERGRLIKYSSYNNKIYLNILDKNTETKNRSSLNYFCLNQDLFNQFKSEKSFINFVLELIVQSYDQILNHRTLSIHISNILNKKGINIKWKLYSLISIFAEKFISNKEHRQYYDPAKICLEVY